MNILAIDDDVYIRRILKIRLEFKGYSVVLLESGQEALAHLRDAKSGVPDLILCDVMMPDMDGYEVCREIRKMGVRCPFLFLTRTGQKENMVRGYESGADDYILKPFDPIELEAKVAAYLRQGS